MTPVFEARLREMLADLIAEDGTTASDVIDAIKAEEPKDYVSPATQRWAEARGLPQKAREAKPVIPLPAGHVPSGYVIAQDTTSGEDPVVFLVDRVINGVWWASNLGNVKTFASEEKAKERLSKLRFGNNLRVITRAQAEAVLV